MVSGQMFVERISSYYEDHASIIPIILIHGDHQTGAGWLRKPDGGKGWAHSFVSRGFVVFVVDLPFHGRSTGITTPDPRTTFLTSDVVESQMTALRHAENPEWPSAKTHTQWPGSGLRGDTCFNRFIQTVVPEYLDRKERQIAGQQAVISLLQAIRRPAILIGHGSGANIAWLVADSAPQCVKAVVAVEPVGPAFGSAMTGRNDKFGHGPDIEAIQGVRQFGIADIPLNFDPPAEPPSSGDLLSSSFQPIPYIKAFATDMKAICFLQDPNRGPVRKLPNLQQMPHAVLTGEASPHSMFDWATVKFLEQAGIKVEHIDLKRAGIHGNGHLCFLEKNSDMIADLILSWL
ncbi:Alpha/Beta hydrolase protein, partial [Lasiosphaeria hispida]